MAILKENKIINMIFDNEEDRDMWVNRYERNGYTIKDWINEYSNTYKCEIFGFKAEYLISL